MDKWGYKKKNRIQNEEMHLKIGVALIEEKMGESRLK